MAAKMEGAVSRNVEHGRAYVGVEAFDSVATIDVHVRNVGSTMLRDDTMLKRKGEDDNGLSEDVHLRGHHGKKAKQDTRGFCPLVDEQFDNEQFALVLEGTLDEQMESLPIGREQVAADVECIPDSEEEDSTETQEVEFLDEDEYIPDSEDEEAEKEFERKKILRRIMRDGGGKSSVDEQEGGAIIQGGGAASSLLSPHADDIETDADGRGGKDCDTGISAAETLIKEGEAKRRKIMYSAVKPRALVPKFAAAAKRKRSAPSMDR